MPKNRKVVKVDGASKTINVPTKNMIGTRKAGTAATLMSVDALMKVASEKGKRGHKARMELIKRGVPYTAEVEA